MAAPIIAVAGALVVAVVAMAVVAAMAVAAMIVAAVAYTALTVVAVVVAAMSVTVVVVAMIVAVVVAMATRRFDPPPLLRLPHPYRMSTTSSRICTLPSSVRPLDSNVITM